MYRRKDAARRKFVRSEYKKKFSRNVSRLLGCESLESRQLLATLGVTSLTDGSLNQLAGDGQLSLREAIEAINTGMDVDGVSPGDAYGTNDRIVFDFAPFLSGPKSISLTAGELVLSSPVEIVGPGADLLTIDANANSRIFNVTPNSGHFSISEMTLDDGDTTGNGGAILSATSGEFSLINSVITGSTASAHGGGIYGESLFISGSTIHQNYADYGGGVSGVSATIVNSTVSTNEANDGGGVFIQSATIENSTISGNTAVQGGGDAAGAAVYFTYSLSVNSSIVANNTYSYDGSGGGLYGIQSPSVNHSLLQHTYSGNVTGNGNIFGADPELGLLTDNGGPTPTHALSATSPALDAGVNQINPATTLDQRGESRTTDLASVTNAPGSDGTDMGAFELQSLPTVPTATVNVFDPDPNVDVDDGDSRNGTTTLREAIALANDGFVTDKILFDVGGTSKTITLNGSELELMAAVNVEGPGPELLSIDAAYASRIFNISASGDIQLSGMHLTKGQTTGTEEHGGAVFATSDAGTITIDNSDINSSSTQGQGGGISSERRVIIANSTVRQNVAQRGGGVHGSMVDIENSTIHLNSSHNGGGVLADGELTMVNSTVSGNTATGQGGGLWLGDNSTIRNSTITGNGSSGEGGGIYSGFDSTMTSSIVANNHSTVGDVDIRGSFVANHSLIENPGSQSIVGNNNVTGQDPNLGPLADNGGPTQTHPILLPSPAIDTGDSSGGPVTDQRGRPRVNDLSVPNANGGDGSDMGAFELTSITVNVFDPDPNADVDNGVLDDGVTTLREALNLGVDEITFDTGGSPKTITLTSELVLSDDVLIDGPGANQLTIDAAGNSRVLFVSSGVQAEIAGVTLTGGVANGSPFPGDSGGGIYNDGGSVTLDAIALLDNSATSDGGGIYSLNGSLSIVDSTLANNQANLSGGGVYNFGSNMTVTNSTFSGNRSGRGGGGVLLDGGPTVDVNNSTFTANHADFDGGSPGSGGALDVDSATVFLFSTIVANNVRGTAETNDDIAGVVSGSSSFNLIGVDTGLTGINGNVNQIGTGVTPIDPLLQPLGDYGGPTPTHALTIPGSPAFETGNNDLELERDQRGISRLVLGQVDVGAVEANQFDFGDAPAAYPTLLADNGAYHVAIGPRLGGARDFEVDGQPSFDAGISGSGGDDSVLDGAQIDDEDGITFGPIEPGKMASVHVDVQGDPGMYKLDAWIDFNRDNSWSNEEQIFDSVDVTAMNNELTFAVPEVDLGQAFARFRLSTAGDLSPTGEAPDGEVEDYRVSIDRFTVSLANDVVTFNATSVADMLTLRANNNGNLEYSVDGGISFSQDLDTQQSGDQTHLALTLSRVNVNMDDGDDTLIVDHSIARFTDLALDGGSGQNDSLRVIGGSLSGEYLPDGNSFYAGVVETFYPGGTNRITFTDTEQVEVSEMDSFGLIADNGPFPSFLFDEATVSSGQPATTVSSFGAPLTFSEINEFRVDASRLDRETFFRFSGTHEIVNSLSLITSRAAIIDVGSATIAVDDLEIVANEISISLDGGTISESDTLDLREGTVNGHGTIGSLENVSAIRASGGTLEIGGGSMPLSLDDGEVMFVTDGTVAFNEITFVPAAGFVTLPQFTVLSNGVVDAPDGVALPAGHQIVVFSGGLSADGTVNGRVASESGSSITASDGNLTIGDASAVDGIALEGVLRVNEHTVTLHDANLAVLGSLTTLGNDGVPGTLVADNGLLVDFGSNITGFGTITTPNDPTGAPLKRLLNNGAIIGNGMIDADPPRNELITLTGYVKGVGTLDNVDTGGATVSPGFSPFIANYGNVTYGSTGTLVIELGGTNAGSGYDQINHSGVATLGGTLDVQFINGFTPSLGDRFEILTSSVMLDGTFDQSLLAELPAGQSWEIDYGTNVLSLTTVLDMVPPTITSIKVGASGQASNNWDIDFIRFVDPSGIGYPVPHGAGTASAPGQLDPLPWHNIRQIFIEFSEDVGDVTSSDVQLIGSNIANYGPAGVLDVEYNQDAHRATITLPEAIGIDKLLLVVRETIEDAAGNDLDGDWQNGISTGPSGDGAQGGDFRFRINVLPGDINSSGIVAINDVGPVRAGLGRAISESGYTPYADLNGSGRISVDDAAPIRDHLGLGLPLDNPSASVAVVPMRRLAAEDVDALFGKLNREEDEEEDKKGLHHEPASYGVAAAFIA